MTDLFEGTTAAPPAAAPGAWAEQRALQGGLVEQFLVPPFSVLDTRMEYWRERRRYWLGLGIESELGRAKDLAYVMPPALVQKFGKSQGTSIFDPVLAELAYRWYCPPGGRILDPFCGGSVRGVVAGRLGYSYLGVELREEQVQANRKQGDRILGGGHRVDWLLADAVQLERTVLPGTADLVFTCPPYHDLEQYSDDPRDLSAMSWEDFRVAYRAAIRGALQHLREDSFSVWVVSNIRGPDGLYRDLCAETVEGHRLAGAGYYNEAVLVNAIGSLAIRAGRFFRGTRKLGRMHQMILCFCKGNAKRATERLGTVETVLEMGADPDQHDLLGAVEDPEGDTLEART